MHNELDNLFHEDETFLQGAANEMEAEIPEDAEPRQVLAVLMAVASVAKKKGIPKAQLFAALESRYA